MQGCGRARADGGIAAGSTLCDYLRLYMDAFRIEPHAHTSAVSPCGRLTPAELVGAYREAGYACLVVTDHFVSSLPIFRGIRRWIDRVNAYFDGYRRAREAAEGTGLTVLPGLEVTLDSLRGVDLLVYGADEQAVADTPDLYALAPEDFRSWAREAGALIFQAHPFRGAGPADLALLDGVEIFNGNARHDSRNDLAAEFARRHSLLEIGGSDAHQPEDIARSGIATTERPESVPDLVALLRRSPGSVSVLTSAAERKKAGRPTAARREEG